MLLWGFRQKLTKFLFFQFISIWNVIYFETVWSTFVLFFDVSHNQFLLELIYTYWLYPESSPCFLSPYSLTIYCAHQLLVDICLFISKYFHVYFPFLFFLYQLSHLFVFIHFRIFLILYDDLIHNQSSGV